MNLPFGMHFASLAYMSDMYQDSAYFTFYPEVRIENINQMVQQTFVQPQEFIKIEYANVDYKDVATVPNTKNMKQKKNKGHQSEVSQNLLNESSEEEINIVSRQKYGRNIISNIVHHMIRKFLNEQFDETIQKIIELHKLDTNVSEFKELLQKKSSRLGIYLKFDKIKALLKGHEYRNIIKKTTIEKQSIFNKVFRILYFHYLKNMHILHTYHTLKLKQKSKRCHIEGVTKLLQLLNQ